MDWKMKWIGQGGFEISNGEKTIFIDPYFSDVCGLVRLVPPPYDIKTKKPDFLLSTHDHDDHLDYGYIENMDRSGVTFSGPDTCINHFRTIGISETQLFPLNAGKSFTWEGLRINAVFANHTEDSIGVVIEFHDGKCIYITGDTLAHEKLGKEVFDIDALFVCINGRWGNMNIEEAIELCLLVKPKTAYPMHYGMFAENTADPLEFVKLAELKGIRTNILTFNEYFEL